MRILAITIQNFRKLLQCHIEFSEKTTLFVVVAYTENEELVKATALSNGWFLENEIYII